MSWTPWFARVAVPRQPTQIEENNSALMAQSTTDKLQEARRPIISLISKSAKAQQKLAPESWQHGMLGENLRALHIALKLMEGASATDQYPRGELEEALHVLVRMIRKTHEAQSKFSSGSSQHTLLRNRLKALRVAEAGVTASLRSHKTPNQTTQRTAPRSDR